MSQPRDIIKVTDLIQRFQIGEETVTPIQNSNFELVECSMNIIFGASGSGMSTLLNILTGLQKPTQGTVMFDSNDVYSLTPDALAFFRATRIGIVYQTNYWVKSLTVLENVALPLYFLGYSRSWAAEKAQIALEQLGMGSFAKKYPAVMSGGEQQRVAIARALVNNPLYIIADEPTGSLDSANGDKIMDLFQKLKEESQRTIILVTHNMEYLPMADHLLHIQDGVIQQIRGTAIQETAATLLDQMKMRINHLSKAHRPDTTGKRTSLQS